MNGPDWPLVNHAADGRFQSTCDVHKGRGACSAAGAKCLPRTAVQVGSVDQSNAAPGTDVSAAQKPDSAVASQGSIEVRFLTSSRFLT